MAEGVSGVGGGRKEFDGVVGKRGGVVAGGGGEVEGGERRMNVEGSTGATVVVEEKQQVHIPKYTPTDQDVL